MPDVEYSAVAKAAEALLSRIRHWLRRSDLDTLDWRETERIGAELGLTVSDLRDLASRGPEAAALLAKRMTALGLTRGDVECTAFGLMRDLERTCSWCGYRRRCAHDLATRPEEANWKNYCPNVIALEAACGARGRFPA